MGRVLVQAMLLMEVAGGLYQLAGFLVAKQQLSEKDAV